MKRYVNRCLAIFIALGCLLSTVGCSSNTPEIKDTTERDYRTPLSTGYTVELADDGYYYVDLDDPEYYYRQYPGQCLYITGNSISEIQERISTGTLTEEDKTACSYQCRETGRAKLCNFDDVYIPVTPENIKLCQVQLGVADEICNWYYHFINSERPNVMMLFALSYSKDEEGYNRSYNEDLEFLKRGIYSRHIINTSEKKIEIFYYTVPYEESNNQTFRCYFEQGELKYDVYTSSEDIGYEGLPPDEWFLSIGMEKYVPQY